MKRWLSFLILFVSLLPLMRGQVVTDSIWSNEIKSVFLTLNGVELEAPVLHMGRGDVLQLRFDLLGETQEQFRYRLFHCDKNWVRDDLEPYEFLNGFEENSIDNFDPSFSTLQYYTNYYQNIPSPYSVFLASGNYGIEVFPQDFPDSVVLTRRFVVCEDLVSIEASIRKPTGQFGNLFEDQELSVGVELSEGTYIPTQYLTVVAQQNGRLDLRRTLPFSNYAGSKLMYQWKYENVFPGGNCFRFFDMSNIHTPMYNIQRVERYGGELFAFLRPEEDRSHKVFSLTQSLFGGYKINVWDRNNPQIEADYAWVNFSLPMRQPLMTGNVYIVGEFTQWKLDEKSRMEWQPQYKAYTKRILLKQGYYSYQLVFLGVNENEGRTETLEGNHYETGNSYSVWVYLRMPNDRYDRLVGIRTIAAGIK